MKSITTIEELYRWRNANNLTGFYQKYSGQPNAQLDEEGNLFVCYDSEGRDVWVSPDGEIYSDTYSSLDENKTVKKNVVKLNEAQLRKVVSESVKKVLNEGGYSPDYMELKKNQWFDMTIDSIMGELWDAVEATDGRLRSVLGHRHYNYTSKKQEDAATAVHNIKSILINNRFNHSKIDKDVKFN